MNPFLRSTQYPYIHMRFPWGRDGGVNRAILRRALAAARN
jgi:hypothetical protein